jgi:hypothetical protein
MVTAAAPDYQTARRYAEALSALAGAEQLQGEGATLLSAPTVEVGGAGIPYEAAPPSGGASAGGTRAVLMANASALASGGDDSFSAAAAALNATGALQGPPEFQVTAAFAVAGQPSAAQVVAARDAVAQAARVLPENVAAALSQGVLTFTVSGLFGGAAFATRAAAAVADPALLSAALQAPVFMLAEPTIAACFLLYAQSTPPPPPGAARGVWPRAEGTPGPPVPLPLARKLRWWAWTLVALGGAALALAAGAAAYWLLSARRREAGTSPPQRVPLLGLMKVKL